MLKVVVKEMFFDRQKVMDRLDAKRLRVLARTGATARKTMQRSMRYRGKKNTPSRPGDPPKASKQNPLLRKSIAFGFDKDQDTVVIGPLVRKKKNSVKVPQLLNEGGTAKVVLPGYYENGTYVPGETVQARYLPRPFATLDSPAGREGIKVLRELTEKTPL